MNYLELTDEKKEEILKLIQEMFSSGNPFNAHTYRCDVCMYCGGKSKDDENIKHSYDCKAQRIWDVLYGLK